jgi:hypothetical protein
MGKQAPFPPKEDNLAHGDAGEIVATNQNLIPRTQPRPHAAAVNANARRAILREGFAEEFNTRLGTRGLHRREAYHKKLGRPPQRTPP